MLNSLESISLGSSRKTSESAAYVSNQIKFIVTAIKTTPPSKSTVLKQKNLKQYNKGRLLMATTIHSVSLKFVHGKKLKPFFEAVGLRQRSVLSPLLLIIYMNWMD